MEIQAKRGHCTISLNHNGVDPIPLQDLLCDIERLTIAAALLGHNDVKAQAANHLMLKRTTLVEKARKYGFPLKK